MYLEYLRQQRADEFASGEPYPNSTIGILNMDHIQEADQEERVEPEASARPGFWRRQFLSQITRGQKKFDWIFGVILPVVCFYFDPIVFKNGLGGLGQPLLGRIGTFAYVLSFTAIMATMAWLSWGDKLRWLNAFLSGVFAVSSLAALAIGVIIAPFSALGIFVLIGFLGFTPLFCSFVLLRNSIRTYNAAKASVEKDLLQNSFALSAAVSAVVPYLLNLW